MGDLEGLLRRVRFTPRASFEPELLGRISRREQPSLAPGRSTLRRLWPGTLLAALAAIFAVVLLAPERRLRVDRCCYDLDGGGAADDGTVIVAQRDGRVYQLSVYEDLDRSGSLSSADLVRFRRVGSPKPEQFSPEDMIRIRLCCRDLDGGGPADDGILVIATPPDRVHNAAIYELR